MVNILPIDSYIKRILFCTDFSENADFAFDFAIDAATRRPGCKLFLLHVVPESDAQFWKTYIYEVEGIDQKAKQAIDSRISERYLPRIPKGLEVTIEFRVGKDYMKILEFAGENNIDLIVIGRQGRSALQKALFGNVTEKIARKAECAVLIVPLSFKKRLDDPSSSGSSDSGSPAGESSGGESSDKGSSAGRSSGGGSSDKGSSGNGSSGSGPP